MKLTLLGTGTSQGVPVIGCPCDVCQSNDPRDNRLRTSALVQDGHTTICIDAGPDFRTQMLREKVHTLDAVLFTHAHKDHTAGLDDVRPFIFRLERPMTLYGTEATFQSLRQEYAYAFAEEKYPGAPSFDLVELHGGPFRIGGIPIIPIPVLHHQMPVLGYRFGDIAYVTDANEIPESSMELLSGVKILILNALRIEKHYSHFNLEEAIQVVEKVKPERSYFTHISHLMGKHGEVSNQLPEGIQLGYDGLEIEG